MIYGLRKEHPVNSDQLFKEFVAVKEPLSKLELYKHYSLLRQELDPYIRKEKKERKFVNSNSLNTGKIGLNYSNQRARVSLKRSPLTFDMIQTLIIPAKSYLKVKKAKTL